MGQNPVIRLPIIIHGAVGCRRLRNLPHRSQDIPGTLGLNMQCWIHRTGWYSKKPVTFAILLSALIICLSIVPMILQQYITLYLFLLIRGSAEKYPAAKHVRSIQNIIMRYVRRIRRSWPFLHRMIRTAPSTAGMTGIPKRYSAIGIISSGCRKIPG